VSRDQLRRASEMNSRIEMSLQSECRVVGHVESKSLAALQRPLEQIGVSLDIDDRAAFTIVSSQPNYEFFVPPGTYTLSVSADNALSAKVPLTVPRSATQIRVNTVDLSAANMVRLVGQAAPELADVVAWKNSKPLKLADLRGKYVLLDFWGYWCGTCVAEMPELFDLQARYSRRLVVIGVHVGVDGDGIDTVEKLDAELSDVRKTIWKGRDLPFPIAMLTTRKTMHRDSDRPARTQSSADYGVQGYPSRILIDPRGNVVGPFNPKEHVKLFD
jgi:thiol-disulfide isomerase/thioredoxin